MRILTYLGFTLLSIFIQFSVMDFIQDRLHLDEKPADLNVTKPKIKISDVLKDINNMPHALYYRNEMKRLINVNHSPKSELFSNSSLSDLSLPTTAITSTIVDVFYDENTTVTDNSFTTESLFTSTELVNVTEITLIENKNETTVKPTLESKITLNENCHCNFLFKVCDINCCCDSDCSNTDRDLFDCSEDNQKHNVQNSDICYSHLLHNHNKYSSNIIDGLFCIVKTNLPERRDIKSKRYDQIAADQFFMWKSESKTKINYKFTRQFYKSGDPLWLLTNGSIANADLPSPLINNYCMGRKPIKLFKDEKIHCLVKLSDLEMFHIVKTTEETSVISATDISMNSSALNCSTLHCISWTVIACDGSSCMPYNKTLNEPLCTDTICTNLALTVDYILYYNDFKIINATIVLHIQNMSILLPFMPQEINVKFFIANEDLSDVIEFSGSPGYLSDLPIIVSFEESNFTINFFKRFTQRDNYFSLPVSHNGNGLCLPSNKTNNFIKFGLNKRLKCRYNHIYKVHNENACKDIQSNMSNLLGLNKKMVLSPFGNPQSIKDKDWIPLDLEVCDKNLVYGEYDAPILNCYNFVVRMSFVFTFANMNDNKDENKIISANCNVTTRNVSFNVEDISTVFTIDINFTNVTEPGVFEYAGSPHMNIHLPKDFFFPYPSNESHLKYTSMNNVVIYCCIIFSMQIK